MIDVKIDDRDMVRLRQAFQEMQGADQKKIFNMALRKATKPTVLLAQMNAHIGPPRKGKVSGNLRRSIGAIIPRYEAAIIIGARRGRGFKGYHGLIVEEGTVDRHYITKRGNIHKTGRMNSGASYAHFLKKAVKETEPQVLNTMGDEWYKAILKFQAKHGIR